jgi:PAT family beta-lactamase induction signal transducer AmpG
MQWSLIFLWLIAFSSATHDVAADGFYMLQLSTHEQALYVGLRNTFYRIANVAGQGLLVFLAGNLETVFGEPARAWSLTFVIAAALFFIITCYHWYMLPRPEKDVENGTSSQGVGVITTIITFFKKPGIISALCFMLLYRFPEALLTPISKLFLIEPIEQGGLGLTTQEVGIISGTLGVVGLLLGGILGGIVIDEMVLESGNGRWLPPYLYLMWFMFTWHTAFLKICISLARVSSLNNLVMDLDLQHTCCSCFTLQKDNQKLLTMLSAQGLWRSV